MPKSLADGHRKLTILTDAPEDPFAPTVAELNDGLDVSLQVLDSDFSFGPTASDSVSERALGEGNNVPVFGAGNWQAQMTFFRAFDETTGAIVTAEETGFQAAKEKGSRLHCYLRENGKEASEPWAATDTAVYQEVLTDEPQVPASGGFIKRTVPMSTQRGKSEVVVAGA